MIRRFVGMAVLIASLSACTTLSTLSPEKAAQLKGKSLTTIHYPTTNLKVMTAGSAFFSSPLVLGGGVGEGMMLTEGERIVKTNNIEDPTLKISQALAEKLKVRHGMTVISNENITPSSGDTTVAPAEPKADYQISIQPFSWMISAYPIDWLHYKITYLANFQLIDSSTQKMVAKATCNTQQGDDKNPPTKDQLLENHAVLLKHYVNLAIAACVDEFSKAIE